MKLMSYYNNFFGSDVDVDFIKTIEFMFVGINMFWPNSDSF